MRLVDRVREPQARDRFLQMAQEGTDHDEHERFGVAGERHLEQVGQL